MNNKPSWQDTLPIKSAPAKKPVASAEKPLAPGSPAATPSKVTPSKETPGTPGTAPSKVTPAKAGTPANPATPPTKVTTANPGAPVANEINVVSTVNTTVSNNVQSNVSMSVNNNVATSVNTSKDNHHTVNMTTSKNANSVNVNSKQQQGTLSVTSTSPGSQIQIRANQGNTGDSSFQLNITGPEPLYVVDGVTTTKNFVYTLDPNKISSMEVLKGTEAIKQYGESGKNGVIKISTK